MKIRDANILIIPGHTSVGEDHWQTRWHQKMPNAFRVEQAKGSKPNKDEWVARILDAIRTSEKPSVLIAHSLGVACAVHALNEDAKSRVKVVGAFLVSPPDVNNPKIRPKHLMTFGPYPTTPLPCASFVVGSRNDPFSSFEKIEKTASDWGSFFVDAGESGHIDSRSGHGPWPEGLMVFAEFMKRI